MQILTDCNVEALKKAKETLKTREEAKEQLEKEVALKTEDINSLKDSLKILTKQVEGSKSRARELQVCLEQAKEVVKTPIKLVTKEDTINKLKMAIINEKHLDKAN